MGKTIIEKIFGAKAGRDVSAGDVVVVPVDLVMGQDTRTPVAMGVLEKAGLSPRIDPKRVAIVIDHYVPCPDQMVANHHAAMRRFAGKHSFPFYDVGSGISHVLMPEQGHVLPGYLAVSCDSHGTSYGAVNAAGIGIGSSEMAAILASGETWFKVPKSMRVELRGKLPPGVYSKDVILYVIGKIGEAGANYHAVEFGGEALAHMSMDGRFTICNMTTDMGGKTALMEIDQVARDYLAQRTEEPWQPVFPDPDASYSRRLEVDTSSLAPQVALPHQVDHVVPVPEVVGTVVQQASIGSCTNSRLEDIRVAASIVAGKKIARGTRFFVVPGTRDIYRQAMKEGLIETLFEAGAIILQSYCATCAGGMLQAIPGDGENVISAANRNIQGRMGNKNASIYLASPATVAASAIEGVIADPRQYL